MRRSALTNGQKSMLLLSHVMPDGGAYNMAAGVTIRPGIDPGKLKQGLELLVRRHDLLRSTFHTDGEGAYRVIGEEVVIEPEIADNVANPREVAQEFVHRSFRLSEELPVRCLLVRTSAEESLVVLVAHHIVMDFHSLGVLLEDLLDGSLAPELEPPAVEHSFTDHVLAEAEWLEGEDASSARKYWATLLQDAPPVLRLPSDLSRPAVYPLVGGTVDFGFSAQVVGGLKAVCRDRGVTPFSYLLMVLTVLLQRYSGQREFVLGSAFSTRGRRSARVVGPFVNTVPIRARPDADLSAARLAKNLGDHIGQNAEHARYPFGRLPGDLGLARDPSRTPIVQVMMTMLAVSRANKLLGALVEGEGTTLDVHAHRIEVCDLRQQEGQFDLALEIFQTPQALRGRLKFNTEVFTRPTAEQLARHYSVLVDAAVRSPDQLIDHLSLVDEVEKARLLAFASGGSTAGGVR